jgi:TATA-box binding protein (TBP) (component of TFIID and TFIIIB)
MVHGADLFHSYPLGSVAHLLCGRYDRSIFPAATCSLREPHATPQIFHSGRIVIPGPKTSAEALLCLYMIVHRVQKKLRIFADVHNFCLDNIVGSFSVGYPLDLDLFLARNKVTEYGTANWDPSLFPGLNFFMEKPVKLQFGLYGSGNIVVLGAPTFEHLEKGTKFVCDMLPTYRVGSAESLGMDPGQRRSRYVQQQKEESARAKQQAKEARVRKKAAALAERERPSKRVKKEMK